MSIEDAASIRKSGSRGWQQQPLQQPGTAVSSSSCDYVKCGVTVINSARTPAASVTHAHTQTVVR